MLSETEPIPSCKKSCSIITLKGLPENSNLFTDISKKSGSEKVMSILSKISYFRIIFIMAVGLLVGTWSRTCLGEQSTIWRANSLSYIDVHNHLVGRAELMNGERIDDFIGAGNTAIKAMKRFGIKKMFIMPPPFSPDHTNIYDYRSLKMVAEKYPDRFAFLGGGGTLNVMIQETVRSGHVGAEIKESFLQKAHEIASSGAIGFGEFAIEHLSFAMNHPYEYAPPDHPLMLILADISARENMPIDIHMEAVPRDMPLRPGFRSPPNPKILSANIEALERLLSHNTDAKIIWSHVGWCNTGYRTVELCSRLLGKYPNLYMSFKISPRDSIPTLIPIEKGKGIKPEWLDLIKSYPDRFLIGADHFYLSPMMPMRHVAPMTAGPTNRFFSLLPDSIAQKVGIDNPMRIYER